MASLFSGQWSEPSCICGGLDPCVCGLQVPESDATAAAAAGGQDGSWLGTPRSNARQRAAAAKGPSLAHGGQAVGGGGGDGDEAAPAADGAAPS